MPSRCVLISFIFFTNVTVASQNSSSDRVSVRLQDVKLSVLVNLISKSQGKTIVWDPRVTDRTITVNSYSDISEAQLETVVSGILRMNGYALVESNGVTKLTMDEVARDESSVMAASISTLPQNGEVVSTLVYCLKKMNTEAAATLLKSMAAQHTSVHTIPNSRCLFINGYTNNIRKIAQIVDKADDATGHHMHKLVLQHIKPDEAIQRLSSLSFIAGRIQHLTDTAHNTLWLFSEDKSLLEQINALLIEIDAPITRGDAATASTLRKRVDVLGKKAKEVADSINQLMGELTAKEGRKGGNQLLVLEADNALLVSGSADFIESVQQLTLELTRPRQQIQIEAIIVETSTNVATQIGFEWARYQASRSEIGSFSGTLLSFLQSRAQTSDSEPAPSFAPPNGLTIVAERDNWLGIFNALNRDTESKVLSAPFIRTLDREEASFLIGQEVPFITGKSLGTSDRNPFQTIERKDVGLRMKVRPEYLGNDTIQLKIEQEISSLSGGATGADVITNKRALTSTVITHNAELVMLGGLFDSANQQGRSSVPILGDIPLLGTLFGHDSDTERRNCLLLMLRATLVPFNKSSLSAFDKKTEIEHQIDDVVEYDDFAKIVDQTKK